MVDFVDMVMDSMNCEKFKRTEGGSPAKEAIVLKARSDFRQEWDENICSMLNEQRNYAQVSALTPNIRPMRHISRPHCPNVLFYTSTGAVP